MGKLEVGLLYVSLHNQLSRRASKDGMVEKKEFFCIIGKHFLIPKNLRPVIIKEMEKRITQHGADVRCMVIGVGANITSYFSKNICKDNNIIAAESADQILMEAIMTMM